MEYFLMGAGMWAVLLAYFAWRVWSCRRRLIPVNQEISWGVYLLTLPLPVAVRALFPGLGQGFSLAVFAVWLVVSAALSYRLNRRFNAWVQRELERREAEERPS